MYFLRVLVVVVCFVTLSAATTAVTQATYNNLVRFAHFSSAAYLPCTTVLGATVVEQFSISSTDTQAYIALDTANKQIIVAFRGSTSEEDFIDTDADILETSYSSPISGKSCFLCLVHDGFWGAWSSASPYILPEVEALHSANPSFAIIVTGHSLGGALTPFAALAIKGATGVSVQLYSYGQPRVGSSTFTSFVDSQIGTGNLFRVTHVNDAVPQLIPKTPVVYNHHSTEYYIHTDPCGVSTVVQCSGDEDSSCSDSQGLTWSDTLDLFDANSPHHTYMGIGMGNSCSGN